MKIKLFNLKVESFIKALEKRTASKAVRIITLLEKFGQNLSMPYSKNLGEGLFELRVRGRQEIRIIYCFYKGEAFLLHAFIKKTQKIPNREINIAKKCKKSLERK